jgi:hypothetical protein
VSHLAAGHPAGGLHVGVKQGHGKAGTLMGFYIRKATRFGPLRINLSRHGVDYSVGIRGARVGRTSQGRPSFTYVLHLAESMPSSFTRHADHTNDMPTR